MRPAAAHLRARACLTPPPFGSRAFDALGLSEETGDVYRDSGLADLRARADEWLMLAQIGSDDEAGFMWGDDGRIYLWIRREDLIARRFRGDPDRRGFGQARNRKRRRGVRENDNDSRRYDDCAKLIS
jgi:hypothetical protein